MTWDYYEDFHGISDTPPEPKKPDLTNLVLLGLGLFAGYLFFSEDKEEGVKEIPKPADKLDNLDKIIANKIEYKNNPNYLVGGRADNIQVHPSKKELEKGIAVEMEHTNRPEIAKEIALDHLAEDSNYYQKLETIHKEPLEVKTLEDLKNWGRQARNIYGRSVLPLMKDEHGNPTQIAMDATALGCQIPKNKKQAKEIARRGTEALRKYKELKKSGIKKNDAIEFKV